MALYPVSRFCGFVFSRKTKKHGTLATTSPEGENEGRTVKRLETLRLMNTEKTQGCKNTTRRRTVNPVNTRETLRLCSNTGAQTPNLGPGPQFFGLKSIAFETDPEKQTFYS